ncbi:dynein heavy chain, cytosolic, putative [Trypanosoma cruzi]|uniref:Dynein heavy chain, cytosolic, putative n=1 Tax=Trypanosoma cruzi (strain CL Brener) TaxID=353153 RepID=Q4CNG7_TRYCC|nr:dynein heavy chain, cytosolic, putative [Trypanosoma cruzi]EAN81819.1 dynein heavy chain, cytosolic, putative [Trypanosoma cruzi]|eukprot:XP_803265.1 dynein heavy chain, cytosolic [Trypanosoma cruzi strain CL Brener]
MRRGKRSGTLYSSPRSAAGDTASVKAFPTFTPVTAFARTSCKATSSSTLEFLHSDPRHVRVCVNDLVAFEYIDENHQWQWGLATVAASPAPRHVQLLLWRHDAASLPDPQSAGSGLVSTEERERVMARLEQLPQRRARVNEEMEAIHKAIATKQAAYVVSRRRIENAASAAERALVEACTRIHEVEARDWRETRCYRNPPEIVVLVMEAVLTVIGEKCVSWAQIQSVIRSPEFVRTVELFDPAKMSAATKEKIQSKYLSNPRFTYGDAMNGSQALGYLQQWVVAQMDAANATEELAEYDMQHLNDRFAIARMEEQIDAFRQTLREYADEEERLHAVLEGRSMQVNKEEDGDNDAQKSFGAEDRGTLRGTNVVWTLTEDTIVTLRSAILCNYDRPDSTIVRLTAGQVQELEDALKKRESGWKDEQRADAARRALQNALEELRGEHGRKLKRLQELESSSHATQQELGERRRELEKLNQVITEGGLSLHTPWPSSTSTPSHATPRRLRPNALQLPVFGPAADSAVLSRDGVEEEFAEKIADLENRLKRALHENPTAAQVQLLEDDLWAVQEELRHTKEELDNFRTANAPNYYTSSALRMEKESTPEAQLAAAQRQIEELEAALEEALEHGRQPQGQPLKAQEKSNGRDGDGEMQGRIQRLNEELQRQRRDTEGIAERLNEELHAHKETRQKLADKECELKVLWDRQCEADREKESTRAALQETERELEKLRGHLREQKEELHAARPKEYRWESEAKAPRGRRSLQLHEILGRLMDEAGRQSLEAKSTEMVLDEVRVLLGKGLTAY